MKDVIRIGLYLVIIGLFIVFYLIYGPRGFLSSFLGYLAGTAGSYWVDWRMSKKNGGEDDAKMVD